MRFLVLFLLGFSGMSVYAAYKYRGLAEREPIIILVHQPCRIGTEI